MAVAAAYGITVAPDIATPVSIIEHISEAIIAGIVIHAMKIAKNVITVTAYATPDHIATMTMTTTTMTIVTTTAGTAFTTVITGAAIVTRT